MLKKKTQANAGNAAVLVLVIMILIILYVLFLPPSIREDILRGNESNDDNGNGDDDDDDNGIVILLEEHVGRLDFVGKRDYEHTIPSFYLYKTTDSVEIRKLNPFIVRSAVFDTKGHSTSFMVKDLENTENVILSFNAKRHDGTLTIKLNGNVIFENDISSYNVEPVTLPKDLLLDRNSLDFEVSEVGWKFWLSHEYQLENLRILGDVTDLSKQESSNSFYITSVEKENTERASLKYSPECSPGFVGRLEVFINNHAVFNGVPDCGILNTHEFSPDLLLTGTNTVTFRTEEGSYLIDLIEVKTRLKDTPSVVYYFELNSSQIDDVRYDRIDVNLSLEFVEEGNVKEARLVINGHELGVYTRDRIYSRIIDPYVQRGSNAVKIVPRDTLDITTIKVQIED